VQKPYLCRRDNLATTSLALGSTFDNTRQIQNLDLGTAILQDTGNGSQRGEGVGGSLALGLGDLRQESRLSDGREANQCYTSITTFTDVETGATARSCAANWFE